MAQRKRQMFPPDERDDWNADTLPDSDGTGDSRKSRSQKKRESSALQERGQELASLSPAVLGRLPLAPELAEALAAWRGLKSHEAKRRHMQYIGRLMREVENADELLSALDDLQAETARDAGRFARLEALRDTLLDPAGETRAEALEHALAEFPTLDQSRLTHLMEAALADREKKRPPRHARELFRYLRDTLTP